MTLNFQQGINLFYSAETIIKLFPTTTEKSDNSDNYLQQQPSTTNFSPVTKSAIQPEDQPTPTNNPSEWEAQVPPGIAGLIAEWGEDLSPVTESAPVTARPVIKRQNTSRVPRATPRKSRKADLETQSGKRRAQGWYPEICTEEDFVE